MNMKINEVESGMNITFDAEGEHFVEYKPFLPQEVHPYNLRRHTIEGLSSFATYVKDRVEVSASVISYNDSQVVCIIDEFEQETPVEAITWNLD
ncbi:MAG: hypothetical protein HGB11_13475 [Chlorobiales bacterium]|nr:hypothetical protein [Chlorobiales bacterium]